MEIKAFYEEVGGSFTEVIGRLLTEERIRRFVLRFPEDRTFFELCEGFDGGNWQQVFSCAHTMKGVCANLGLERLKEAASALTENVRDLSGKPDTASLFETVRAEYEHTVSAIRKHAEIE